jgi:hypothetical protein
VAAVTPKTDDKTCCSVILTQAEMAKEEDLKKYCAAVIDYVNCVERRMLIIGPDHKSLIKDYFTDLREGLVIEHLGTADFDNIVDLLRMWDKHVIHISIITLNKMAEDVEKVLAFLKKDDQSDFSDAPAI